MSALLQGVPRRSGSAIYTLDGVAAPDHFANGLPYEADGALATAFGAVIDHWHQGLPFTAVGRLAIGSGTPEYFGSGHAPFNITGLLDGVNSPSVDHFASGVGYSAVGRFNYQNVPPTTNTLDNSGTGLVGVNGDNFLIGTATGVDPTPVQAGGFDIFYFGSFGQNFWNLRMGSGTDHPFNATSVDVQLNGTMLINLPWNVAANKFQGSAGEDLWAILGAENGNVVPWTINFKL